MSELSVADRIAQVLDHLGIKSALFAGGGEAEYRGLVAAHPDRIASISVFRLVNPDAFQALGSRFQAIFGDRGPITRAASLMPALPGATHVVLEGYDHAIWSDVVSDRRDEVSAALREFLRNTTDRVGLSPVPLSPHQGEVAGVSYQINGSGPPLVLLPIGLAATQWDALLDSLAADYSTIVLGGRHLGFAAVLENRGSVPGYLRMVSTLLEAINLTGGERVLDIGCGTGVLDRWLTHRTGGANPVVAVDANRYLLREAESMASQEGLQGRIDFRVANAEALPFENGSFDVAIAVTVLEEGDAQRMLDEMVRVVRPGGRVGAIVRGDVDMSSWVNLRLRPELKARLEAPGSGAGKTTGGVADAGLYSLFARSGLERLEMFPQLVAYQSGQALANVEAGRRALLSETELEEWRTAREDAANEGTFLISSPFHCAVGTKPS